MCAGLELHPRQRANLKIFGCRLSDSEMTAALGGAAGGLTGLPAAGRQPCTTSVWWQKWTRPAPSACILASEPRQAA
jgi:hypothetical protein